MIEKLIARLERLLTQEFSRTGREDLREAISFLVELREQLESRDT